MQYLWNNVFCLLCWKYYINLQWITLYIKEKRIRESIRPKVIYHTPKKANSHKSFRKHQNKEPTHSVEVKAGKLRQQSKFILCSNLAIYFIWNHQIATISKPNFRHDPLKSLLQCLQNGFFLTRKTDRIGIFGKHQSDLEGKDLETLYFAIK